MRFGNIQSSSVALRRRFLGALVHPGRRHAKDTAELTNSPKPAMTLKRLWLETYPLNSKSYFHMCGSRGARHGLELSNILTSLQTFEVTGRPDSGRIYLSVARDSIAEKKGVSAQTNTSISSRSCELRWIGSEKDTVVFVSFFATLVTRPFEPILALARDPKMSSSQDAQGREPAIT
jgi:hypothetical protein